MDTAVLVFVVRVDGLKGRCGVEGEVWNDPADDAAAVVRNTADRMCDCVITLVL